MIGHIDPSRLGAQQKAEIIYAEARSELSNRLWQAALGTGDNRLGGVTGVDRATGEFSLDSLLAMLAGDGAKTAAAPPAMAALRRPAEMAPLPAQVAPAASSPGDGSPDRPPQPPMAPAMPAAAGGLGVNAQYQGALNSAAARTGIPAAALAAIVHAESAKGPGGRWLVYSRNPRSSAAGLGQFLNGTWQGETERKGTWLNGVARERGWLNAAGKVRSEARSELLALRYDGEASIQATADYARANLDRLQREGVEVGGNVDRIAQTAYLGHHLGLGDAIKFLKGGLDSSRARLLLNAQVGSANASERIAAAGSAAGAHRAWLNEYVGKNLQPSRFQGERSGG
ncbi:hypothetical protein [Sphingomonas sp. KC8]|uniref:hypothetical protein n=1 Tax=Sphingomonas sp. KC8 TaxID=1030157 RepID=UPI0002488AAD|nr:hypothetical protein [Sphingomonas sp. KC8]ARS28963.1 peptidoglycan-binding protein [Sphingomonas sp. KC8]